MRTKKFQTEDGNVVDDCRTGHERQLENLQSCDRDADNDIWLIFRKSPDGEQLSSQKFIFSADIEKLPC